MHQATMGISEQFPDGVHPNGAGSGVIAAKDFTILTTPKPVISQAGTLLSVTQGFGYQWYLNGTAIAGATGQTYTASILGNYSVGVKVSEIAEDFLISTQLNVETLGISAHSLSESIIVSPNPGDALQLFFTDGGYYKLSVVSLSGQNITSDEIVSTEKGSYKMTSMEKLASGLYMIKIVDEDGNSTIKKWHKK